MFVIRAPTIFAKLVSSIVTHFFIKQLFYLQFQLDSDLKKYSKLSCQHFINLVFLIFSTALFRYRVTKVKTAILFVKLKFYGKNTLLELSLYF